MAVDVNGRTMAGAHLNGDFDVLPKVFIAEGS